MHIFSVKFFQGNNIKDQKRLLRIGVENSSKKELKEYINSYINISASIGYYEKFIDMEEDKTHIHVWVTYTEEDISNYIIYNLLEENVSQEIIKKKINKFLHKSFLKNIVKAAENMGIPNIELSEGLFQLGYGAKSIIISPEYQSYENMVKVAQTMNRKSLFELLRYNNLPKVDMKILYNLKKDYLLNMSYPVNVINIYKKDNIQFICKSLKQLKTTVNNIIDMYGSAMVYHGSMDYRVIAYKGKNILVFKTQEQGDHIKLENEKIHDNIKELINKVYNVFKIEFMYVDLYEDNFDENKLKVIDLGSAFYVELFQTEEEVISFFVDNIREQVGLIPIISVTGTNGKTTTTRLIHYIMSKLGYKTGMASTEGIFVDFNKIKKGDTTGFLSARELLTNGEVEACVLETARGGIARNGLGYEQGSVGIITSISEDHIGMEGTKNIEDLIQVKSTVINELKPGGKAILKAQEELSYMFNFNKDIKVCLFNIEKNNFIKNYIKEGKEALYLEDSFIVYYIDGKKNKIVDVSRIPFTHYGKSKSNIMNVMSSIAAVYSIHNNIEDIIRIINNTQCDLYINPGRQNIIDMNKYKIILDYGHNSQAFREVFSIAEALKPSKITAIIAAPGDRMDKYIKELGQISAEHSNHIIIREQADLRSRKKGESALLIKEGALNKGFSPENLQIIYKEEDAIVYAMERAIQGEVIVLFTQCLGLIIETINLYLESKGMDKIGEGLDFSH